MFVRPSTTNNFIGMSPAGASIRVAAIAPSLQNHESNIRKLNSSQPLIEELENAMVWGE
jgi:hypothetical protein